MSNLDWDINSLSLGIIPLDAHHQEIFQYGQKLCAYHEVTDSGFSEALSHFTKAVQIHFKAEAILFEQFKYPRSSKHIQEHTDFLIRIQGISKKLEAFTIDKITRYIEQWFTNHIQQADMDYVRYFEEHKILLSKDFFKTIDVKATSQPRRSMKSKTLPPGKIKSLDEQHREIAKVLAQIKDLRKTGVSEKRSLLLLPKIITMLEECGKYFSYEEEQMEELEYPSKESHLEDHKTFNKKIKSFKTTLTLHQRDISDSILVFLKDWTMNHILKKDREYKAYLHRRGYK
ncbi:bacteriohemerythrin [Spirochaeta cellobiosiphila]|uniref:bacteriohemerythrin n=1 Tax=Spirochaeta cellobiosiphila TaxID=504483 RepID=UPI00048AB968|nr:hemerythrin domain-containing protein [Spirochaeta cellobiosiphila]